LYRCIDIVNISSHFVTMHQLQTLEKPDDRDAHWFREMHDANVAL